MGRRMQVIPVGSDPVLAREIKLSSGQPLAVGQVIGSCPISYTIEKYRKHRFLVLFSYFLGDFVDPPQSIQRLGQQKGQQIGRFSYRKDADNTEMECYQMASIIPNFKEGKIISYKFKACVGRDDCGKQVFRCMTWKVPVGLGPVKADKAAEKQRRRGSKTQKQSTKRTYWTRSGRGSGKTPVWT